SARAGCSMAPAAAPHRQRAVVAAPPRRYAAIVIARLLLADLPAHFLVTVVDRYVGDMVRVIREILHRDGEYHVYDIARLEARGEKGIDVVILQPAAAQDHALRETAQGLVALVVRHRPALAQG